MGNLQKEIKSKHYIQGLIEEGEHEHQDFKYQISDARKIARSISAFANNDGGRLLVGVKDNGNIIGVESDEEIYMIEQAATMYCRPAQRIEFSIYKVEGKSVLKVDIKVAIKKPVQAQDDDGKWHTYYRVADENILAHPLHVKLLRQYDAENGTQLTYGNGEREIIEIVRQQGNATVEECVRQAHSSRYSVEMSLLALCRIGTLSVKYDGSRFMLVMGNDVQ